MLCEALPPKIFFHSTLLKERMRKIKRHNLSKTEQSAKTNFFESLTTLRSKNFELTKDAYISEDHAQNFSDLNNFSVILQKQNGEQQKSVPAQKSKSSIIFLLEALLGTTMQENKDTKALIQK